MKLFFRITFKIFLILTILIGCATTQEIKETHAEAKVYKFSGGPAGGTFRVFANAIPSLAKENGINIRAIPSNGSLENIRLTNSGRADFSLIYSSHVFSSRNGMLKYDPKKYKDILAIAWLYGAPAQLVVRKGAGIKSVKDLVGKKVGVSNTGSGSFFNCKILFTHIGVWDKIDRNAMGYNDAAAAFGNEQLDAFWLFTAFPSGAVIMAAQKNDIDLIDLDADAEVAGFYKKYPFFTKVVIPAGTYRGVFNDTPTFQDSALWVANSKVSADVVYNLLSVIYTNEGLKHIHAQKKILKEMSVKTGATNIVTPFHPGAEKFWKEKGMLK